MNVFCDMVTDGGGWTVIQRRVDGSTNFYLDWASYKQGFGSLTSNFWLGNDNIHRLTTSGVKMLRVNLENWEGKTAYAVYGKFVVDDENNKYKLSVADYNRSCTAGNSLRRNNNKFFTTKDRNNLHIGFANPARDYIGGWWYYSSPMANLNGQYLGNALSMSGITWMDWTRSPLSLKRSEMKLRPSSFI